MADSTRTIIVNQDPEQPVEKEVLATAITDISSALKALQKSGLNKTGIVVLLQDKTRLPKKTILIVLDGLEALRRDYTTL